MYLLYNPCFLLLQFEYVDVVILMFLFEENESFLRFPSWEWMSGWSMIVDDNCGLDCSRTPHEKGICSLNVVPPMLGDGKPMDLIELYLVVRDKGGYHAVSANGLWGLVAEECGLALNLSPFVKLIYAKYLEALEEGFEKLDGEDSMANLCDRASVVRKVSIELAAKLKELIDKPKWTAQNMSTDMDLSGSEKCPIDDEESVHMGTLTSDAGNVEAEKLSCNFSKSTVVASFSDDDHNNPTGFGKNLHSNITNVKMSDEDKSVVGDMDESKECVNDGINVDSFETSIRKRKRESMSIMLNWINGVAKGPCDNVVDPLPESSKWESCGTQEVWKQVLLIRKALFLKKNFDSGAEQSTTKKHRKMHPCLYDSQIGSAYNFRERQKVRKRLPRGQIKSTAQVRSQLSSSNTATDSDSCNKGISDGDSLTEYLPFDLPAEKIIPLGPDFQADIPEWTGVVSQSDLKWLGIKNWPLEKVDNRFIVEREPTGKGRQDSCGCEVPKSIECVRFHIAERRMRVKRELGTAFNNWGFDKMGEDVRHGWKAEEEKKFEAIVQSNPPSLDKCFWDEIFKYFRTKKREDLVNYYFNVFLSLRRAHQNRRTPHNIDSDDDDESESGSVPASSRREVPKSPGSLLYSAKKSRKKAY